ncbi:HD domain-containing protein [Hyperthermus butylicus]|uniref:Hydrolase of HD superfamily n=1 Tax=Hyperthermus butylicus (strain DSM 5456 / JCM 9403 / PLM1-5) TaxID=415426 RepID=A2BL70_HYPBU|nr:HD family hydrolase [Hyperthermus butylicus]ABM80731.1 putative hydrolase of HD superfamily [Hyperthermus butylicus DSM 5456]
MNYMKLERLAKIVEALKTTPRTGWLLRGVYPAIAETIAAHMYESAVLALMLGEELRSCGIEVDPQHAAAVAIVHDAAEAIVGDIVKYTAEAMGKELKERIEVEAARKEIPSVLLLKLLEEYVAQNTMESELVKIAEMLSTLIQSLRYIQHGFSSVSEIACSTAQGIDKILNGDIRLACLRKTLQRYIDMGLRYCSKK